MAYFSSACSCEMEILKLFLLIIVMAINLGSIHSSCLTSGDSSGSNSVSLQSLSDAIIQYTLKQYKVMLKDPKTKADNIITSPYSIWSALALTYFGSRGQSSDVLGNLLGLNGMNKTKVEESVNQLRSAVSSNTGKNTFTVANTIAVERSLRLKSCIANDPFISVSRANFKYNSDGERIELNKWVESKTNDLITDLLPPGSVNSLTVLAIINAVYFKGDWLDPFEKELTRETTFTSPYKTSKVQMMVRQGEMNYGNDDNIGASYVDLPYIDDKYSMLAILPYETNPDIDIVIGKMTPTTLQSIWRSLSLKKVLLQFPRFEMTESFTLKDVLSKMGASSLFRSIDLSGVLESRIHTEISDVFHKAFIKVEEKGTEAAAATGILIATKTVSRIESLNFNRPFAFVLREKRTNTVLFMGVVRSL